VDRDPKRIDEDATGRPFIVVPFVAAHREPAFGDRGEHESRTVEKSNVESKVDR
jgi:hypothetical protein